MLTNSFCMYLLETANIMFLSFKRFELLSFEHGNPITQNVKNNSVALLLGYNKVFFHTDVLDFLPIYFPYTFCAYLESVTCFHGLDLIVQFLYVHLKDRNAGWK